MNTVKKRLISLADEIIQIRISKNISQSEIANILQIRQQQISCFEKTKHNITLKTFLTMLNAMDKDIKIINRKKKGTSK